MLKAGIFRAFKSEVLLKVQSVIVTVSLSSIYGTAVFMTLFLVHFSIRVCDNNKVFFFFHTAALLIVGGQSSFHHYFLDQDHA